MRYVTKLLLGAAVVVLPGAAMAQPACVTQAGGLGIPCFAQSANLQPTDVLAGAQKVGPGRSNQTVNVPIQQVINMDHSLAQVIEAGTTNTNTLAGWVHFLRTSGTAGSINIGGQNITLPGGQTANQGSGSKLQTASGGFTPGNAPVFSTDGSLIDSGTVPSGGTGGGGTVATGAAGQLIYHAVDGTVGAPLASANSSILVTDGSGIPSWATTAPSGMTFPNATLNAPTMVGNATGANLALSGNLGVTGTTTIAPSTSAGALFVLLPGVAPSSPTDGMMWLTTGGVLTVRGNGVTQALKPLPATTNGVAEVNWDSNNTVTAQTYDLFTAWPYATGTIDSMAYFTNGTTPSWTATLKVAGSSVPGCSWAVTLSTVVTKNCTTGSNTVTTGQRVQLVISSVSGTPNVAGIQVGFTRSFPN